MLRVVANNLFGRQGSVYSAVVDFETVRSSKEFASSLRQRHLDGTRRSDVKILSPRDFEKARSSEFPSSIK
jgi:glutamine amidotransferase PdxT